MPVRPIAFRSVQLTRWRRCTECRRKMYAPEVVLVTNEHPRNGPRRRITGSYLCDESCALTFETRLRAHRRRIADHYAAYDEFGYLLRPRNSAGYRVKDDRW